MYDHHLDTFLAVCQYGSFTTAARKCYITPSAVVQQINLLEKHIGVKLFLRTNRGIQLTPAGEILHNEAPELIRHASEMAERMKKAAGHRPIRLGWSTGAEDPRFLSECLALRDAHDGLQINLTRITGSVPDGLAQHEFDLCQYTNCPSIARHGYAFTPLYTVRQCIVLPPEHPLENRAQLQLEDLYGMELVLLSPGVLTDHDRFRSLVCSGRLPIRLIEVDNYDFETRSVCYSQKLPFLGMEPLMHQYAPLTCVPGAWDIPVHIGLISREPAWEDLALLVQEMERRFAMA